MVLTTLQLHDTHKKRTERTAMTIFSCTMLLWKPYRYPKMGLLLGRCLVIIIYSRVFFLWTVVPFTQHRQESLVNKLFVFRILTTYNTNKINNKFTAGISIPKEQAALARTLLEMLLEFLDFC